MKSLVRIVSVCLLAGPSARAADRPLADAPWRPVALQPEQSLSLLDAVRLTLQNDPNIRLVESQYRQKEGVTQELAGQRASVALYDELRGLIRDAYQARCETPWRIPTEELYLILRAGEVVPPELFAAAAEIGFYVARAPVRMEGRIDLLHYYRQQSVCTNYHRYGNLAFRAEEFSEG